MAALTVVSVSTAGATSAQAGSRPAVVGAGRVWAGATARPEYSYVGSASSPAATSFSCQTTTPAQCYGPAQIRAAYGTDTLINRGVTGKGTTITIIDAFQSPTIASDLATFDTLYGLPAPVLNVIAPDGLTPFDQTSADETSWAGEITLDVEYAHAIAPAATIDLVLAKSDQDTDLFSAQQYVVSHNLGDVISQSFGEAEGCMDPSLASALNKLYVKAATQGQTVFASSADQGAALPTCDGTSYAKAVSMPASDPYVTGVGGTILDADGTTGAYHGETTWNEPEYASASGGGYSSEWATPSYQRSLRLPSRGVPDVAYNAAITGGVLVVWSTSGLGANLVFIFGGTSAGSPQWAGLVALATQLRHHRIGFINPAIYLAARSRLLYGALFHDITTGDNTYHGDVTVPGYAAQPGWDPATGLGSPRAQLLVPALALAG